MKKNLFRKKIFFVLGFYMACSPMIHLVKPMDRTTDLTETTERQHNSPIDDFIRQFSVGSALGIIEVTVNQPLIFAKNCIQQGKPLPLDPKMWFRGYGVNAGSMSPITALQMGVNSVVTSLLTEEKTTQLSDQQKVFAATLAGAISALVSSPAEYIMLQQQNTGLSFLGTTQVLMSKSVRAMLRGFTPTACRDGGFTAGYLVIPPLIQRAAMEHCDSNYESLVSVASGVAAGVSTAILTQPFDVMATTIKSGNGANMREAFAKLYYEGGVISLFRGLSARGACVILAISCINALRDPVTTLYNQFNS